MLRKSELSNAVFSSIFPVRKPLPRGLKGTKPIPSSSRVGSTPSQALSTKGSIRSARVPQFQVTTGDGCPTPRPRLLTSDFCLPGEHRTPNTGHRMGVDACAPSLRSHFIGSHLGVESFVFGRLGVGRCPQAETSNVEGRTDKPKNGTNDRTAPRFPPRLTRTRPRPEAALPSRISTRPEAARPSVLTRVSPSARRFESARA